MTTLQGFLNSILLDDNTHRVPRFARHLLDPSIQENVDAFICEQAANSLAYIWVFSGRQSSVAINHSHFAAESPHGLGKLYAYVATADHEEMFGNFV